ncbi:peptide-methionine (S)-S-oxide reductase MsrA [Candidatus Giovannonibacteria bacterium]|nr:peptide-methionine (S)-S-oxide reductase MsrA [Candidatus Giovannonibacteria bacterium]
MEEIVTKKLKKATFAAGCFWQVEEVFRHLNGVKETRVGYTGGTFANPTYEDVCSGKTGHAEAVEVTFDPEVISFEELLENFWANHDPTLLNRQGDDIGKQYRSAVFFHTEEQEKSAIKSKERLAQSNKYENPVVTEIVPVGVFYPAENYHQQYLEKKGISACNI